MPDIAELLLQLSSGGALRLTQESVSLQIELHHSNQQCNKVQSILLSECKIKARAVKTTTWLTSEFRDGYRQIPQCAGH